MVVCNPLLLVRDVYPVGLIHGFGLSTRLPPLPLGEKGPEMFWRIISFNVGVEIGQVAALLVMLLVITELRKHHLFKRLSRVINDGLMLAGFMLLLMQLHGYLHNANPDEFGLSKDNHIHHHMSLEKQKNKIHIHDNL